MDNARRISIMLEGPPEGVGAFVSAVTELAWEAAGNMGDVRTAADGLFNRIVLTREMRIESPDSYATMMFESGMAFGQLSKKTGVLAEASEWSEFRGTETEFMARHMAEKESMDLSLSAEQGRVKHQKKL
jgi:hypothetical protein